MKKPNNYDNTQVQGTFEPLELGGHVCKIIKLEETKSSTGRDMLKIAIDVAEGEQKGYFKNQFDNDSRNDKKWPNSGMVYVMIEDKEGNCNQAFKTLCDSVEKSNGGFSIKWGEDFGPQFKGKLIGGVFGREEYKNSNQELKFSTKCRYFVTVDKARKGVEAPKDKLLQGVIHDRDMTPTHEEEDDMPF